MFLTIFVKKSFFFWAKKNWGHWKANRAQKIIGRVHDRRIFLRDFANDFDGNVGKSKML